MRWVLTIGFIGLSLWAAGFVYYVRSIPAASEHAADMQADAIIVLTGGADRIAVGFDLLARGVAPQLMISGVGTDITIEEIIARYAASPEAVDVTAVTLDPLARNTRQNARETNKFLQHTGHKTIMLVTANYHMPRSLLEMHHAMPQANFIPYAVDPTGFDLSHWWTDGKTRYLMLAEYHKIMLVRLRHMLRG